MKISQTEKGVRIILTEMNESIAESSGICLLASKNENFHRNNLKNKVKTADEQLFQ